MVHVSDASGDVAELSATPSSRANSTARKVKEWLIAAVFTVFALYALFGIPAYLLFGMFFTDKV